MQSKADMLLHSIVQLQKAFVFKPIGNQLIIRVACNVTLSSFLNVS